MNEQFDEDKFHALLAMAGPAHLHELTRLLDDDLSGIAAALMAADVQDDPHSLRAHSHVLLAVAGTVGAMRLYLMADRLNRLARGTERGPVAEVLTEIRALLALLIGRVRHVREAMASL